MTAATDQGFCSYCHTVQTVRLITDPEMVAAIAEDAQDSADYYLADEHNDPRTGAKCRGSGKTPEGLYMEDLGTNYGDPDEDDSDEPLDWGDDDELLDLGSED